MPWVPYTDTGQKAPQTDDARELTFGSKEYFRTGASHSPLIMEEAKKDNPPCKYLQKLQIGLKGQLHIKMRTQIQLPCVSISSFLYQDIDILHKNIQSSSERKQ